jgi:uncharacterized membrane protein
VKARADLDAAVEVTLTAGLAMSATMLVLGLVLGRPDLLRWGIVLLMLTPVARVVVVTTGFLWRRDLLFGLVSLWILGILAMSMWVGLGQRH